jgi:hypothetical protein
LELQERWLIAQHSAARRSWMGLSQPQCDQKVVLLVPLPMAMCVSKVEQLVAENEPMLPRLKVNTLQQGDESTANL